MPTRSPIPLIALLLSLLALPAFARPNDPPPPDPDCPGPQNPGGIWKQNNVDVYINPSMDPRLEQGVQVIVNGLPVIYQLGNSATRRDCFQQAVHDWNAVLKDLCGKDKTPLQLTLKAEDLALWGVDMGNGDCFEAMDANFPVFRRTPLHNNDNKNVASTGHNHLGDKKNPADGTVLKPGWINAESIITDDPERLAETYPRAAGGAMLEADIGWMTHFQDQCERIDWDYRLVKNNAADLDEPNAPDANSYDFYSVMLHELGHLLGLGHITDPNGQINNNVMYPVIKKGERKQITKLEVDCLKKLYCVGATPVRVRTWGELRKSYR